MKALSVKQPFAFLIGNCEKSIELRSWKTDYKAVLAPFALCLAGVGRSIFPMW